MITGYRITQKQPYRKKNGEMSEKDVESLNSCSQVEVLKWFVEEWKEVRGKLMEDKTLLIIGITLIIYGVLGMMANII